MGLIFTTENHNTAEKNTGKIRVCSSNKCPSETYIIQSSIVETHIEDENEVIVGVPIIASTSVDQIYNSESENAQSGKAVSEALKNMGENEFKTINGNSIYGSGDIMIGSEGSIAIDYTYSSESKNAQSGKAVTEALLIKPGKKTDDGGEIFNDYSEPVYQLITTKPTNWEYSQAAFFTKDENDNYIPVTGTPEFITDTYYELISGNVDLFIPTDTVPQSFSHIEGSANVAGNKFAHIECEGNYAGKHAHAEGRFTKALGIYSHTEGQWTVTKGNSAHAEGVQSVAMAQGAHAEGGHTVAKGHHSHAEGYDTTTEGDGKYAHAEGNSTTASAQSAHAEGVGTYAKSKGSHAEGEGCTAGKGQEDGKFAHAEGYITKALGESSHAEGNYTIADGSMSHAEGNNTKASGRGSHAEGTETTAQENYSHAEGNNTTANGIGSHAEGLKTTAQGNYSHAEGNNTTANGTYSHAQGQFTLAETSVSSASGMETHAKGIIGQSVVGKANKVKENALFIVGNGTPSVRDDKGNIVTNAVRKNAFEVYDDGHAEVQTMGENPNDNTVVNKKYVDQELATYATKDELEIAKMCVLNDAYNIDELKLNGKFAILNATGTLPDGYSADDNNIFIECDMWFEHFGRQILHDVRTNKTFSRNLFEDVWQPWEFEDRIVESGTSGIFTYEKWASGKAVFYGKVVVTQINNNILGKKVNFPFTISDYTAIGTLNSPDGNLSKALHRNVKIDPFANDYCQVYVHDSLGGFASNATNTVSVEIKGRWK